MGKQYMRLSIVICAFVSGMIGNAFALDYQTTEKNLINNRLICETAIPNNQSMRSDFIRYSSLAQTNTFPSLAESDPTAYENGPDYGRLHRYLGYSTVLFAGLAAVTSSNKSVHYGASYACAGAAVATCATGFAEYGERFDLEEGVLSNDNLHINLGIIGTIAFSTAIAIADSGKESGHSSIGVAGGVAMLLSVVVIKW